jgi:hypothetical protein
LHAPGLPRTPVKRDAGPPLSELPTREMRTAMGSMPGRDDHTHKEKKEDDPQLQAT